MFKFVKRSKSPYKLVEQNNKQFKYDNTIYLKNNRNIIKKLIKLNNMKFSTMNLRTIIFIIVLSQSIYTRKKKNTYMKNKTPLKKNAIILTQYTE